MGIIVVDNDLVRLALLGYQIVGIVIRTLSMDGRNFQIGSDFG